MNRRNFDEGEEDFPFPPHFLEPTSFRERSFLFSDGSLSPLRNKLPNLAPLPSKSTIDNFARPITQITDARNNTTAITPKRPLPKIEERNLSKQLNQFFQMLMRHLKKNLKPLKKKVENVDEIIDKVRNDRDEQKIFEFEFFTGGTNQNLIRWFNNLDFQARIWSF